MRRREALAALALGLTGCGRRAPAEGEISLWFTYGGKNREVLLSLVDAFHRAQSGVVVRATFQGDYFEGLVKLRTGMFVRSIPTISHVVGEVVPYLAEAGALEALDDIGPEVIDDLEPSLAQSGTFLGAESQPTWALPFNRSTPICFYNRDQFARLGLSPPRTWEELREAALRLRTADRWGFECPVEWWFWVALVGQAGGRIVEEDGRVSLGGEAGVAALELWQTMVHRDRSMRPPPGRDYNAWEATNSDFLAGRAAMIWTSTAFLRYLEDNAAFAVGAAPLPKRVRYGVPTGGTFFVMPRGIGGAEREAGLAFLRFMMSPERANEWAVRTGYMPVSRSGRRALEASGHYREHPNDAVTLGQLGDAMPWPWSPDLFRVQREAVQPRLEEAVLGRKDARTMLDEARRAAEAP